METIFANGRILTMAHATAEDEIERAPEALLARDGRIACVGDLDEVRRETRGHAAEVDLDGRCLAPAFVDGHGHIVMGGHTAQLANLGDCSSFDDIVGTLQSYARERGIDSCGVIYGFGYDHNFLEEGRHPDRRVLDRVSSEIPVYASHVSGHMACVNSRALEIAGIDAATPDPDGGRIGRLEGSSEPSGYLEENAIWDVQAAIAQRRSIDAASLVRDMQLPYLEHGIATVQDGATTAADLEVLERASDAGELKVDIVAYPLVASGGDELLAENPERVRKYVRRLKLGGYKLILDGSPQGRSAWMSEPYLGGEKGYCGYPWMSDPDVEAAVRRAIADGQQLLTHCNGDAASEQLLDIYGRVAREMGAPKSLRPVMIHCQTVRDDQLDRMAELGMLASIFVGHVWYWGDVHVRNFGEERGSRVSPVASALSRGISVNLHQDAPITPPDMLHSVWCAANRITRSGETIGPEQRVSVHEAMRAATIGGAYEYFEEREKGTLETGKRADFAVLAKSPLEVAPEEVRDIRVEATWKDGECVWER